MKAKFSIQPGAGSSHKNILLNCGMFLPMLNKTFLLTIRQFKWLMIALLRINKCFWYNQIHGLYTGKLWPALLPHWLVWQKLLSISPEGEGTGVLVKDARMISGALKTEPTLLFIRQCTGTQATFPILLSTAMLVSLTYLSPLSFFW